MFGKCRQDDESEAGHSPNQLRFGVSWQARLASVIDVRRRNQKLVYSDQDTRVLRRFT